MGIRTNDEMDCVGCGKKNEEQKCVIFGPPDEKDPSFGFSIGGNPKCGIKAGQMCCKECWDKAELKYRALKLLEWSGAL